MSKLILDERKLLVKEGIFNQVGLEMDSLRFICLVIPGTYKWRVISSSQQIEFIHLDLLDEKIALALSDELTEFIHREKAHHLAEMKLCLTDYGNYSAVITFKDLKKGNFDFFQRLHSFRKERIHKLKEWLRTDPRVELRGAFGATASLDRQGFKRGKKKFISWGEVGSVHTETVNLSTHLLVLPIGVSGGMFSLKKYKYSLQNIPAKKKEFYIAECNFWRSIQTSQEIGGLR